MRCGSGTIRWEAFTPSLYTAHSLTHDGKNSTDRFAPESPDRDYDSQPLPVRYSLVSCILVDGDAIQVRAYVYHAHTTLHHRCMSCLPVAKIRAAGSRLHTGAAQVSPSFFGRQVATVLRLPPQALDTYSSSRIIILGMSNMTERMSTLISHTKASMGESSA